MAKQVTIWQTKTQDCLTTIELQQWLPLAALIVFFVWYIAAPTKIAAMAAVTLLGIHLCAYGWARSMAKNVNGKRQLHYAALQVGDELEEEISLDNQSRLPVLWAEFSDRSDIPSYTVTSVRAADPRSNVQWWPHTICSRRGVFALGPWQLTLGDPFGLFRVTKLYPLRQEILVYPPLAELPQHILPHSGGQGDQRPLHQPIRAETINATASRPFIPGDPLRHLHWKTTARKDSPYVKLFEPEAANSVWLIADCQSSVQLGKGNESTFETMIVVMASLAANMLHDQLSVGLFALSQQPVLVMPTRGQPHLWEILRALAPLQPTQQHSLAETLDQFRPLATARNFLVIVTPSLNPHWLPYLHRLTGVRGMRRAEVILLDPISFGGQGRAESFIPLLTENGITARVLEKEQVKPIQASYGELSRWEFKTLATGRAFAIHSPHRKGIGPAGSDRRKWVEQG